MKNPKQFDIIHCQFGPLGILALQLKKIGLIRGKIITSFRGYDISRHVQQFGAGVYKELFRGGDFFLTNCEYFQKRLLSIGCPPNLEIIRSGIDCQRFAYRLNKNKERVCITTIGRFVEKKGIEYVIRAIDLLHKEHYQIELKIVGDGPLKKSLWKLVQQLNLLTIVDFMGSKTETEIIEILQNSDIFVGHSITAKDGNQDGPTNTLKEAMAIGLPVVSTFHGGIPELVQDKISGLLIAERDTEDLKNKIEFLIHHREKGYLMGKKGREHVEKHYNIKVLNQQLSNIYLQILHSQPSHK